MTAVQTPTPSKRRPAATWHGPTREYDLVKELVAAFAVVALLTAVLAAVFSSPDEKPITLQSWAAAAPGDFVATATGELAGTTTSAGYGAPYTTTAGEQSAGPIAPQKWAGVRIPVDPAQDFVVGPVSHLTGDGEASSAVRQWTSASPDQQTAWAGAYADALAKVDDDPAKVPSGDYGPVPVMTTRLLTLAASGGLDSALVSGGTGFYQTDYTRPLLFLADGSYLDDQAGARHLHGDQWGMMNETGDFPGQAWLWLYTFWYQVPPFTTAWADNADLVVWGLMMLLSVALVLVPFIPGVRSIPRLVPIHRLIWRDYYRTAAGRRPPG